MDNQITLRLPTELTRRLNRQARARGVKKSQIVREAVLRYLDQAEGESPDDLWNRVQPLIGSLAGATRALKRDPLAWQIYQHNVRE